MIYPPRKNWVRDTSISNEICFRPSVPVSPSRRGSFPPFLPLRPSPGSEPPQFAARFFLPGQPAGAAAMACCPARGVPAECPSSRENRGRPAPHTRRRSPDRVRESLANQPLPRTIDAAALRAASSTAPGIRPSAITAATAIRVPIARCPPLAETLSRGGSRYITRTTPR